MATGNQTRKRLLGRLISSRGKAAATTHLSSLLKEIAQKESAEALEQLKSAPSGLNDEDVAQRLEQYGLNELATEKRQGWTTHLWHAFRNPLVILLLILAAISFVTKDIRAGIVMSGMVTAGVLLRFVQEFRAGNAAARLKAMISVTATAVRNGQPKEIPLKELVPGDIVKLSAGDMIPADVRIISAKDLFVTQSSLTGESFPVEKFEARAAGAIQSLLDFNNICFMGTSVESGAATALVVLTGAKTYLGGMASSLVGQHIETAFDRGITRVTWLMISFMVVLVPLVFIINGLMKHNWQDAFFFAMAVAVGLTPEMLPMIVTVCLSKGAISMSRNKVIVKRIHSIQEFGGMDVLCTDKTGTLTMDHVILEQHCDVVLEEDEGVLELAYLNSYFQTGLKNVLDRSILDHRELHRELNISAYKKLDEIPFDFSRKIMSVVVGTPEGGVRLIAKGATEKVFERCALFELDGDILPMEKILIDDLREEIESLGEDGFRVLAIAYRDMERKPAYSKADESDLILKGYVAFLDPPKETASPAIAALNKHGVSVKILTGDNERVSKKICREVGISVEHALSGEHLDKMTDEELAEAAEKATLFARLLPSHKQRIIRVLQGKGHVVGYLGDGINDAPALAAADVGISVDTAVDIAKESADIILLEKSLMVLEEGVREGRKVFANILKYIRMGASSNFGNMFSVLGASAVLPFLPMAPIQILTNNIFYDLSQISIPTDDVDPEQIAKPMPWSIDKIARFIVFVGPLSSIFDYTTYFVMWYVFRCQNPSQASLFQSGWFVESLLTQTLIIHVIRTNKIPIIQSRASWPLITMTLLVMGAGMWLPYSPLAPSLGFTPLPPLYWPIVFLTLLCYTTLTHTIKRWLLRKDWI